MFKRNIIILVFIFNSYLSSDFNLNSSSSSSNSLETLENSKILNFSQKDFKNKNLFIFFKKTLKKYFCFCFEKKFDIKNINYFTNKFLEETSLDEKENLKKEYYILYFLEKETKKILNKDKKFEEIDFDYTKSISKCGDIILYNSFSNNINNIESAYLTTKRNSLDFLITLKKNNIYIKNTKELINEIKKYKLSDKYKFLDSYFVKEIFPFLEKDFQNEEIKNYKVYAALSSFNKRKEKNNKILKIIISKNNILKNNIYKFYLINKSSSKSKKPLSKLFRKEIINEITEF